MTVSQKWIAFQAIFVREVLRFSRIWVQTILPPSMTTALYFVIFGGLIGPRIGEMEGFTYMEYIIPGLIMMSVITSSYANVVSSFYMAKFSHSVEEMLVSPVPDWIVLAGYVGGGVARGMTVGISVTLVSLLFSDLSIHSFVIMTSTALLTAILFSLAGFINAVYARSFDDISIVPTFILTPLTYLGGIFYSVSMLPEFWQNVSLLNPILYMINTFRYGVLGVTDITLVTSYVIIFVFIAALSGASLYLLKNGVGIRD